MALAPSCPRCPGPVREQDGAWSCSVHGSVPPLWRPGTPSYDDFGAHLKAAGGFPTYLPWPMPPGWQVTDFGVVGVPGRAQASVTCVGGSTPLDGPVEVILVSEEPGTGLGARCAGTVQSDPGEQIALARPGAKLRVETLSIPLWPISTHDADPEMDRSVFAGEAQGRWLWVILRPAPAMLLLAESWMLADVSGFGAELLELPFGGHAPTW